MKLILGLVFLLAAVSALAQVAPAPPRAAERLHTNYEAQVPRGIDKAPPDVPSAKPQTGNAELADLLRKQTEAIRALSGKLTELEARVAKLERGAR
jgi:hypothetical protein